MPYTTTRKWDRHADEDPTCNLETLLEKNQATNAGNLIRSDLAAMEDAGGELVRCSCSTNGRASMSFQFVLMLDKDKAAVTKTKLEYVTSQKGEEVTRTITNAFKYNGDLVVEAVTGVHETIAPGAVKQPRLT